MTSRPTRRRRCSRRSMRTSPATASRSPRRGPMHGSSASAAAPALETTPLRAVIGRPIFDHLPRGADGKTWQRWQNEIQMMLHAHAVNDARAARGARAVTASVVLGRRRSARQRGTRVPRSSPPPVPPATCCAARHGASGTPAASPARAIAAIAREARPPPIIARCVAPRRRRSSVAVVRGGLDRAGVAALARGDIAMLALCADGNGVTHALACAAPVAMHPPHRALARLALRRPFSTQSAADVKAVPADLDGPQSCAAPSRGRAMLDATGIAPVLARLFAARGIGTPAELDHTLARAAFVCDAAGIADAAARVSTARSRARERIVIVADYDADGATACAVGVRGLRAFGAQRRFHRAEPLRVWLRPDTGNRRARSRASAAPHHHRRQRHRERRRRGRRGSSGIDVLVTDHHLPGGGAAIAGAHRRSESGRMRVSREASCGRRRDVLRADRHCVRICASAARSQRGPNRISARCSISSRSAPWPTSCVSTRSTARSSRKASRAFAPDARIPASRALFAVAGRDTARRRRSTSASSPARASTPPAGLPTCRSASAACSPTPRTRRWRMPRELDRPQSTAARRRSDDAGTGARRSRRGDARCPATMRTRCASTGAEWHPGVVGIVAARIKDRCHRPTFVFARGERRRAQRIGPVDRRIPSARRAGSRHQARAGHDPKLRRPRLCRRPVAAGGRAAAVRRDVRGGGTRAPHAVGAAPHHRNGWRARAGRAYAAARPVAARRSLGPGLSVSDIRRRVRRRRPSGSSASATSRSSSRAAASASARCCSGRPRRFPRGSARPIAPRSTPGTAGSPSSS